MLLLTVVTFLFPSCTQALVSPFPPFTTAGQTKVLSCFYPELSVMSHYRGQDSWPTLTGGNVMPCYHHKAYYSTDSDIAWIKPDHMKLGTYWQWECDMIEIAP